MICFNSSPLFPLIDTLGLGPGRGRFPLPHSSPAPPHFPKRRPQMWNEKWHKSSPRSSAVTRAINVLRPETPSRLKGDSSPQARALPVGMSGSAGHLTLSVSNSKTAEKEAGLIRSSNRGKWLGKIAALNSCPLVRSVRRIVAETR